MSKLIINKLSAKILSLVMIAAIFILLSVSFAAAQSNRQLERDKTNTTNTESRTALVIGNGSYADSPLKNPTNDATDMAAALKKLGFEVLAYTNLDQNGMKKAIRDFGAKLRTKGGVGLFYYAGHGVQVKGVNYLIPVSANVNTEEEVEYESVEVGLVLAQMEAAKNPMNIVILDACRNNPFARSFRSSDKGLASIDAPSGTLLAYSTAPGSVASDGTGRNGLYTQELLKAMQTDGLSIEDIFKRVRVSVRGATADKQTPWESSSLTGNFYFTSNSNKPGNSVTQTNTDKSVNQNNPVTVISPKQTTSVIQKKKEFFFTFELQKCAKAGTVVICDFIITNNDSADRSFYFSDLNPSTLIDDTGSEVFDVGSQIANKSGFERMTMLSETPVKAKVTFRGIAENATEAKRLKISFIAKPSAYVEDVFYVEFRNVPLQ